MKTTNGTTEIREAIESSKKKLEAAIEKSLLLTTDLAKSLLTNKPSEALKPIFQELEKGVSVN